MSFTQSVADELLDLMQGLGNVSTKKMFGELGFYLGPKIFACLIDDEFYLRATGAFADELKALGGKPFTYGGKSGKQVTMPYVTAPQACIDDADEMVSWCNRAIAAQRSQSEPAEKKAKPKRK